jgi:kynurenine formamidase
MCLPPNGWRSAMWSRLAVPVYQRALVEAGVYLIENVALEEVAQDRLASFRLILLATKYRGATDCPVRPIALV